MAPAFAVRRPLAVLGLFLVLGAIVPAPAADPPRDGAAFGRSVRLKDQLEKGLKARRPEDLAFVARVVRLVEQGALSRRLVDGVFLWARGKPQHTFQYFRHALTTQARRRGVRL